MRRLNALSLILGTWILMYSAVFATDARTGLWHLLDDEHGNTICFMVNGGPDSWRLYSADWEALSNVESSQDGAFRVVLPFGNRTSIKVHVE